MAYQLVDTYTGVILSNFAKKAEAEKQLNRMYNEPGETRYEIKSTRTKKVVEEVNVEEESD
jgi:hypothetical protein|tara:strand:- start:232 stop:414 length:183 start_codon:yes stop_codon:yes gene_type:complete